MFELKNWVDAMEKFRQTQTIYKKLSEAMSKEEQPVYLNMVDEIAPNIRFDLVISGFGASIIKKKAKK